MNAPTTPKDQPPTGDRIAKVLARAGVCSRRDAERMVLSGRISVNGTVLESPAYNVTDKDKILVDGKPLQASEPTRVWRYHKPRGQVTTARDPEGRTTVFDSLPKDLPRVISIGRLDVNTEGLLLLTNDGALARKLELPATGWARRYRVRAHGRTDQAKLDALQKGIKVDGVQYGPIQAHLERDKGTNIWIAMTLREGKNREIKRVLETLGLDVNRLIRTSFGPFQLGDLAEGAVQEIPARVLADQLGDTDRQRNQDKASGNSSEADGATGGGGRASSRSKLKLKSRPVAKGKKAFKKRKTAGDHSASDNKKPTGGKRRGSAKPGTRNKGSHADRRR